MANVKFYCDSGQYATKFCVGETLDSIRSLAEIGNERVSPYAYVVQGFHNVNYIVGDDRLSINKNFNISKADMVHKVCTYTMIHQNVKNGDVVDLIIGTPISLYMNAEHREEYIELMHDPEVEFTVDGVKKKFKINSVSVLPESLGYVYNHIDEFGYKVVGVVDIGGLNMNAAIYQDLYPIKGSDISLNLGANILKTRIKDALNERFVTNIQDYQIESIIKNGLNHPRWEEMEQVINNVKHKYVVEIIVELKKRNWDIDTIEIHFTGGGTSLISDILSEIGNFVISDNLIFDNVTGFKELGGLADGN